MPTGDLHYCAEPYAEKLLSSRHQLRRESGVHRFLVFGGLLLLVVVGLALCTWLTYYSLAFFAPGM